MSSCRVWSTTFVLIFFLSRGINSLVSDSELSNIASILWNKDVNRDVNVKINAQSYSSQGRDSAPKPLFTQVSQTTLSKDTFQKFIALLDNYERLATKPEISTKNEEEEIKQFLQAVGKTSVMNEAHKFLASKNLVPKSKQQFMAKLRKLWFDMYTSSRIMSSSGFEHVFLGEVKKQKLVGFHNWIAFYLFEKTGDIDYTGHKKIHNGPQGIKFFSFTANLGRYTKPVSSMIIGSSPEYELALYTVCIYARPNDICKVPVGGLNMAIKSYTLKQRGQTFISTAYPVILKKK